MIDHASVAVGDLSKAKQLYEAMLAPLSYELKMDLPEYRAAGFGVKDGEGTDFWLGEGEVESGVHVAFAASSKEEVDGFHAAGIAAGGSDNGAPGYREQYARNYYGAFIHDLDGNNIEAVFRDPSRPSTPPDGETPDE